MIANNRELVATNTGRAVLKSGELVNTSEQLGKSMESAHDEKLTLI